MAADIDIPLAAILGTCVFLFTASAWRPVLKMPNSARMLRSVLFLTLSSVLQIVFLVLVSKKILTLEYSLRFAAFGFPLCVLALVLARHGRQQKDQSRGAVIEAWLGLAMWMFLITAH
jgi:tellurite resistance protein TehA-like permease